jgi:hypothetical protein
VELYAPTALRQGKILLYSIGRRLVAADAHPLYVYARTCERVCARARRGSASVLSSVNQSDKNPVSYTAARNVEILLTMQQKKAKPNVLRLMKLLNT